MHISTIELTKMKIVIRPIYTSSPAKTNEIQMSCSTGVQNANLKSNVQINSFIMHNIQTAYYMQAKKIDRKQEC